MYIKKIDEIKKQLVIDIPLTTTSGKTRIKTRSMIFEYGLPHAGRTKPFMQSNYVEWQIGYDAEIKNEEKMKLTSLKTMKFIAYNGKNKALYELSEYLFYFCKWGIIKEQELLALKGYLNNISKVDLVDNYNKIYRSQPIVENINGIEFYKSEVIYPLLVHKFGNYEIIAEIITKEKQYAVGIQPMLYFCFPITELKTDKLLIGRTAESKEFAQFIFNENNCWIILEMMKIFGILSENHKYDVSQILDVIINS